MHQPVRGIRSTFLDVIEDFIEYITFEISEFVAYRARGATLNVGGLNSDSKWGAENTFFSVSNSLKFPKKWGR